VSLALLGLVLSQESTNLAHRDFLSFITEHKKSYTSDAEFNFRFKIFSENLKVINQLNRDSTDAVFGVGPFTDLTPKEFKDLYLMRVAPRNMTGVVYEPAPNVQAPASFDWRTKQGVSAVKNQGQCGSCWAFSATGNIESVYKIGGHAMPILAPQQMVDCDKDCYGCGGGWPYKAMNYIVRAGGQDAESSYPYTARNGQCRFKTPVGATIKGYKNIGRDEHTIQASLTTVAPFSVCVDASQWSHYKSGVLRSTQCGKGIDHCVQLVGYDASANPPYWIVRNSWGTGWGVSGYIYLEMWKDTCAMADQVITAYL
jgi:C1A family cysteine protease